jgi:hypothetical protein
MFHVEIIGKELGDYRFHNLEDQAWSSKYPRILSVS